MSLMTLELHYPSNWAYEGTVDICYVDGNAEKSYGQLQQGSYMSRETYAGHRWHMIVRARTGALAFGSNINRRFPPPPGSVPNPGSS